MKTIEMIAIPVSDQEKAKKFYTEKVGFHLMFEGGTPDGGRWIQVALPGSELSFTLVSGKMHASPGSLKGTIILTDDIEKDISVLQSRGVKAEPVREFPHGRISSFQDPDGNQWVLRQP